MKIQSILFPLFIATTASAKQLQRGLRAQSAATPHETTLALIEVATNATIEFLRVGDDVIVLSADADEEHKQVLKDLLEDAKEEKDARDLLAFFQKVSGGEDAPAELIRAVDTMEANKKIAMDEEEEEQHIPPPPRDPSVDRISGEHGDHPDGDRHRNLLYCSYWYGLIGDYYDTVYDNWVWSELEHVSGNGVGHMIFYWNGYYYQLATGGYIYPGGFSRLEGWSGYGNNLDWWVETYYGAGGFYNWAYC